MEPVGLLARTSMIGGRGASRPSNSNIPRPESAKDVCTIGYILLVPTITASPECGEDNSDNRDKIVSEIDLQNNQAVLLARNVKNCFSDGKEDGYDEVTDGDSEQSTKLLCQRGRTEVWGSAEKGAIV